MNCKASVLLSTQKDQNFRNPWYFLLFFEKCDHMLHGRLTQQFQLVVHGGKFRFAADCHNRIVLPGYGEFVRDRQIILSMHPRQML